jgi:transposase
MARNFIECDREQALLMPPSLREWLPEDHLAWFVVDAVEEMDLDAFYADYRADGPGAAAYEPSMMVALLLYAYATKQRSRARSSSDAPVSRRDDTKHPSVACRSGRVAES